METQNGLSHIPGWGTDLDHKNRPAYPKERIPARDIGVHWTQVDQQPQRVKVFHSNERPSITPVFGTSTPPSGLSGLMRAGAFKFSENDIRHWMILLLADRVNVVEGILSDLGRGHIPNFFAEMGLKSEFKYNRPAAVRKMAVTAAVAGVAIYLLQRRKKRKS